MDTKRPAPRMPEVRKNEEPQLMCPRCNTIVPASAAQWMSGADLRCHRCGTEVTPVPATQASERRAN